MILTVNIGNTHITIGGYEQDCPAIQRAAPLRRCLRPQMNMPSGSGESALSVPRLSPPSIEGGILGSVVPALTGQRAGRRCGCSAAARILTVGPGLKSGIKLRLDNPAQLGAELLCGAVAALAEMPRPAGRHLSRHRHLHHGRQRQAGAGGRCHPARAAALAGRAGAEDRPAAPDRPFGPGSRLRSGQEHSLPVSRMALYWAPPACWTAWPTASAPSSAPRRKFYATGSLPRSIREACRTPIHYRETLITDGLYQIWLRNRKG